MTPLQVFVLRNTVDGQADAASWEVLSACLRFGLHRRFIRSGRRAVHVEAAAAAAAAAAAHHILVCGGDRAVPMNASHAAIPPT